MHPCTALLVAALAACAIARPPGATEVPDTQSASVPQRVHAPLPSARELFGELLLPRFLLPKYSGFQETAYISQEPSVPQEPKHTRVAWTKTAQDDYLDKEMMRLEAIILNGGDDPFMDETLWEPLSKYEGQRITAQAFRQQEPVSNDMEAVMYGYRVQPYYHSTDNRDGDSVLIKKNSDDTSSKCPPYQLHLEASVLLEDVGDEIGNNLNQETNKVEINNETDSDKVGPTDAPMTSGGIKNQIIGSKKNDKTVDLNNASQHGGRGQREQFALTPKDKEYFEHGEDLQPMILRDTNSEKFHHEGGENGPRPLGLPPRQIRQNPISKQKHLLEPDIGKLKTGFAAYPSYLDYTFSVNEPDPGYIERSDQVFKADDPFASVSDAVLIAAIGAALILATVGFVFWYSLTKRAKAAADVDYPGYGVTGPSIDPSGDRKLAQSAHMYHYHHQKQQIIAMERNGLERRTGSVSDVDSEEENEEGDYTVYECPGFATTGEMEVKNPLFSDDPTPATPGKCQVVKQQPK